MHTIQVEILKPGLFSTLQDQGRNGMAFYAIPQGGAADLQSHQLANSLLGNPIESPTIECIQMGISLKFHDECYFVICGSNFGWMLNGKSIPINKVIHADKNAVLSFKNDRTMSKAYIAFKGHIKTSQSFNSYSTLPSFQWGGNSGRQLQKGDIIQIAHSGQGKIESYPSIDFELKPKSAFTFNPGPEWNYLSSDEQSKIFDSNFKITPQSNRMGARLQGPELISELKLMHSVPVIPGMIQLLPSGQLIVVLEDGQTTGGYPRVGYIERNQLNAFNQLLPHQGFRFINK